ncbi:Gp49 family protein [Burkholderia glumae]
MATQSTPRNDDDAIEREIQAKGKTAPRLTPDSINDVISSEVSFVVGDVIKDCPISESTKLLTICVLTLRNGFTVTGESACASPENFDAEIGFKIARQKAVEKIWPLEGYLLKQRLNQGS